jgi:FMN phosphatase YigB (HAD superfamily)
MALTTLVFDAYGTLFDVAGAARIAAADVPTLTDLAPPCRRLARQTT